MIQNGQLYRLRCGNVAVEIATEQMRVRVQRQECALPLRLRWSFVCSRCRYGYGLALGGYGKKQIEADEHFYGFGERTGLLDKLAERKTGQPMPSITAHLAMNQAIPFFIACVQKSDMAFFNTTFGASSTSVPNSLECGKWKRALANWTTTLFTVLNPPRFSAPTPSLLVGCRCRRAGRLVTINVAGATNLKRCVNLHGIPRPYPLRCHPLDIDYMRLPCSPGVPSAS